MKKYLSGLAAIAVSSLSIAFTRPTENAETEYWEYISTDNSGFRLATKYAKVTLNFPEQPGCSDANERPCILQEATGNLSTYLGLQIYLNKFNTDIAVVGSSIHTKEFQEESPSIFLPKSRE